RLRSAASSWLPTGWSALRSMLTASSRAPPVRLTMVSSRVIGPEKDRKWTFGEGQSCRAMVLTVHGDVPATIPGEPSPADEDHAHRNLFPAVRRPRARHPRGRRQRLGTGIQL